MDDKRTRRSFVERVGAAAAAGPLALVAGSARSVETAWERTYGRDGVTWTDDVVRRRDGGYLLACSSAADPGASTDAWLVAVDDEGAVQWDRTYGGDENDKARAVVRGPDGGYAFLGVTYSAGDGDAWLVAVDDEGAVQWDRVFPDRYPRGLCPTADGGYLVAGRTGHAEDPSSDAWLAMLSADGETRWAATYPDRDGAGEYLEDEASALAETDDGYVFVGSTERAERDSVGWLATVDETGRLTDEVLLPEARHLSDVATTAEGVAVAGVHRSSTATYDVGWLAALTGDGSVEWSRTWRRITPNAVTAAGDGLVVAGDRDVPWPFGYFEGWAASVSAAGDERWRERFSKRGGEGVDQALPTGDGGVVCLGHTGPAFPENEEFRAIDAWLFELSERSRERGLLPLDRPAGRPERALGALSLALAGLAAGAVALIRRRRADGGD